MCKKEFDIRSYFIHTSYIKNLCLYNVTFLKSLKKIGKEDFEILRKHFVIFNDLNNRFIYECARKKKAKITESWSFLVEYRKTYVPKKS